MATDPQADERPRVLVLNGPNLNLLGAREPEIYGTTTLGDIEALCARTGERFGLAVDVRQSNHEGHLVDWIQEARDGHAAIVVNAAAYSHTSVAIHDALKAVDKPIVEVHLSNLFRREAFRHHSHVTAAADGMICGFGAAGYALAIEAVAGMLGATDLRAR